MEYINRVIKGNTLSILKRIPDATVQCVVTSPPYWGLRDYGTKPVIWDATKGCEHVWGENNYCCSCNAWKGSLGLESSPFLYIKHIIQIFKEVKRVLKPDGTLWFNIGDSYYGGGRAGSKPEYKAKHKNFGKVQDMSTYTSPMPIPKGFKPKDLAGIPWRTAMALQDDGWYLRSDIIWSKTNPMPNPVKDRPTTAHEYVFLLSKNGRYYYDYKAIMEPNKPDSLIRNQYAWNSKQRTHSPDEKRGEYNCEIGKMLNTEGRNKRSVWTIPTKPFPEAHFAVMPEELAKNCILAGTKKGDLVLDPFGGAGTTAVVAKSLGRKYVSIELNKDYVEIQKNRLNRVAKGIFV